MPLPGMAYGAAAPWQSTPIDKANFFSNYPRTMYPASAAPQLASALTNIAHAELDLQKVLGPQTMYAFRHHPFFPAYYKNLGQHVQVLRQTGLCAGGGKITFCVR